MQQYEAALKLAVSNSGCHPDAADDITAMLILKGYAASRAMFDNVEVGIDAMRISLPTAFAAAVGSDAEVSTTAQTLRDARKSESAALMTALQQSFAQKLARRHEQ